MRILILLALVGLAFGCSAEGVEHSEASSVHQAVAPPQKTFGGLQQFSSEANVIPTSVVTETCTGDDGQVYSVTSIQGEGPFTSAELGDGTFHVEAKLLHGPDGRGISLDNVLVLNGDGSTKFHGRAMAVDGPPGQPIVGLVNFKLPDGAFAVTGTTVTLPPPGVQAPIKIEYGTANPNVPQLGFTISGDCKDFMGEWRGTWDLPGVGNY